MGTVGIRALKQNASQVIAEVVKGAQFVVTDRGRPVARLSPVSTAPLGALVEAGRVRPRRGSLADLPAPQPGAPLAPVLQDLRADERY